MYIQSDPLHEQNERRRNRADISHYLATAYPNASDFRRKELGGININARKCRFERGYFTENSFKQFSGKKITSGSKTIIPVKINLCPEFPGKSRKKCQFRISTDATVK